jgi:hypothetical protein
LDSSRLRSEDLIAGASGLALLVVMFLPWYGVDVAGFSESWNAWKALSFIDLLLFLAALLAIGYAVAKAAGALPPDVPWATLVTAAGAAAVLLILFRIIDMPTPDVPSIAQGTIDFGRKIGLFLGLVAAAGIAYGGWRAMGEPVSAGDSSAYDSGVAAPGETPSASE